MGETDNSYKRLIESTHPDARSGPIVEPGSWPHVLTKRNPVDVTLVEADLTIPSDSDVETVVEIEQSS